MTTDPASPAELLQEMAAILEVTGEKRVKALAREVNVVIEEYREALRFPPTTPLELTKTFERMNSEYRSLFDDLKKLGATEKDILARASSDFFETRLSRGTRFGLPEALSALEPVGALLRSAMRYAPQVKPGPQPNRARQAFVARLGIVYAKHRPRPDADRFEMPTRRHNPIEGQDYGPFRDFVIAALQAATGDPVHPGIDDVIRSVWGGMGKKPARKDS